MADDDVVVKFGASLEGIDRGIKAIEQHLQELKKDTKEAASSANFLATSLKGIAAAVSLDTVISFISHIGDMGEKAERTADMLGLTTEQVTSLQFATAVAGGSAEAMTTILEQLARKMDAAASGGKAQIAAFKEAGVQWKAADGSLRPLPDVLNDLADAFQRTQNGPEKTALAMELMGRAGAEAIPLLNGGSKSLREMGEEAEKAGFKLSTQLAHNMGETGDKLDVLGLSLQGLGIKIFTVLKPAIDAGIDMLTRFVQSVDAKTITSAMNTVIDVIVVVMQKLAEAYAFVEKIINDVETRARYVQTLGLQAFTSGASNLMHQEIDSLNTETDEGLKKNLKMFEKWGTDVKAIIDSGNKTKPSWVPGGSLDEADKPKFTPPAAPPSSATTSALNSVQSAIEAVEKLKLSIQDQIAVLGLGTAAATAYTEEHKVLALAQINNVKLTENQQKALKKYAAEAGEAKAQLETLTAQQDAMRGVAEGIAGAFGDWLNGTTSLGDALIKMTLQLAAAVAEALLLDLILSAMGLAAPTTGLAAAFAPMFGGFKADGGPLKQNEWYIAGEHGPEPVWGGGNGAFATGYGGGDKGGGGMDPQALADAVGAVLAPMFRQQNHSTRRVSRTIEDAKRGLG